MNPRKVFNILFIVLFISFSHVGSAAADTNADTTAQVICNIIGYVWGIGGPLMTVVIIGAALLAIFGRMPWPALFALGIFYAVFFGAKTIVTKVMGGIGGNTSLMDQCGVDKQK
ncbi:TrbC/VirB2 family protein [Wolbachia endosymbiont (group A) of Norellia spinipes]|uniref:TrbC/VirB2 family protein n=1 Tax=Wolbachia endosymbiont (group A) of Norellia spinipes TaxID=3066150 RepID=UPI0036DCC6C6